MELNYKPHDSEAEKASNSYLMSLAVAIVGMPLPIVNLVATLFFLLANRRSTVFVRWHCIHALLSQLMLWIINSISFTWTMLIVFSDTQLTNQYIAYIITVVVFNIAELIANIYSAIKTREGIHVRYWFFGDLTDAILKIKK